MNTNPKDRLPVLLERALQQHRKFIAASGSKRLDAMLDRQDAPLVIQRTRAEDLHYLVKSIGINDSQEIMLYASIPQLKDFLSIELFQQDRFVPERLLFYIDYLNAISHDKVVKLVRELDPEGFALLIRKYADVKVIDEDHDPQDEENPLILSPDNVFMIVFRDQEATGQAEVKRVLELLYETDIALGRRVLFMCMYDVPSNIEENLFGMRENHMEEMGFPNYDERLNIYEWVPAGQMRELVRAAFRERDKLAMNKDVPFDKPPAGLVFYDSFKETLLYEAISRVQAPGILRMVLADFQYLVDAVLRARYKDLSVDDAWLDAAITANAFVSVGLDFLTSNNPDMAAFVLEKFYLKDIFRVGFTLWDQVAVRARKVVSALGSLARLFLFDDLTAAVIKELQGLPARFYEGLKDPALVTVRFPMDYGEVLMTGQRVDMAAAVLDYMTGRFGFDPSKQAPVEGMRFDAVFNTAAVRALLYGEPGLKALNANEVTRFIELFLKDPQTAAGLKAFAAKEAEAFYEKDRTKRNLLRRFTDEAIDGLVSDLAGIDTSAPVDTRFIGERLLVVEKAGG